MLMKQRPEGLPTAGELHSLLHAACSTCIQKSQLQPIQRLVNHITCLHTIRSAADPGQLQPVAGAQPPAERPFSDELANRTEKRHAGSS